MNCSINFLDDVFLSALTSTPPHTTPIKTFPGTSRDLRLEDDARFVLHPSFFQELIRIPPSEYIVLMRRSAGQEGDEGDEDGETYDEIEAYL